MNARTAPALFRRHARAAPGPAVLDAAQALLTAPFDALRFQYAGAVTAGLLQRSLLASGRMERMLDSLERLILGPLARRR